MSSDGSDRKGSSGAASDGKGHSSRKDRNTGRIVKAGSKRASSAGASFGHSSGHDKASSSKRKG
ncbi:MAG: hypothetical protein KHY83_04480 [Coriobacteriia bacterium]|nr:hypothetical protein [Coriobacteriia bacterium]MBS5477900.1 hypothetical protein [Coriobacteriia bacterium]